MRSLRLEYYDYESTLWIHLDDGRVIEIRGDSYEDVTLQHKFLSFEERRAAEHARQGWRERLRNNRRNVLPYRKPVTTEAASVFIRAWEEEMRGFMNDQSTLLSFQGRTFNPPIIEFKGPDDPEKKSV